MEPINYSLQEIFGGKNLKYVCWSDPSSQIGRMAFQSCRLSSNEKCLFMVFEALFCLSLPDLALEIKACCTKKVDRGIVGSQGFSESPAGKRSLQLTVEKIKNPPSL